MALQEQAPLLQEQAQEQTSGQWMQAPLLQGQGRPLQVRVLLQKAPRVRASQPQVLALQALESQLQVQGPDQVRLESLRAQPAAQPPLAQHQEQLVRQVAAVALVVAVGAADLGMGSPGSCTLLWWHRTCTLRQCKILPSFSLRTFPQ